MSSLPNFGLFKHAFHLHNLKPIADHETNVLMNFFTGEEPPHHLNNTHVFDYPIDILEKNLVNDKGIPNAPIVVFTLVILNIIPVMLFLFGIQIGIQRQNLSLHNITLYLTRSLPWSLQID